MSVPERLALIGGSILLASLLIFTLRDQVSKLIPSVFNRINDVFTGISQSPVGNDATSSSNG